ncbi:hypothetical protein [Rheinheimera maricola]|uniref:DUF3613 domain-containing protein n=1 Tax=Rheinheimera maricola TaxID=2793282 RepID=A0ABS7X615_9GAMM|nr:hypothetical protein [Rheinheimera maricola]MBZ9610067.1 hypothetical protein [Rheinheimera maricola]
MHKTKLMLAVGMLHCLSAVAQQAESVKIETTVSGNQEQPKTIYVLPWQSPVSVIRIPGQPLQPSIPALSPLDRQQFLRFIALQQANSTAYMPQATLPQKEQ